MRQRPCTLLTQDSRYGHRSTSSLKKVLDVGEGKERTMSTEQLRIIGIAVALGISIGVVIGAVTDNVGLWVALGVTFGAAAGTVVATVLRNRRGG